MKIFRKLISLIIVVMMVCSMLPTLTHAVDMVETEIILASKNAYSHYIKDNATQNKVPEYYLYEEDGHFVLLKGGHVIGVYLENKEVLKAILGNPEISASNIENGIYQNNIPNHTSLPLNEFISEIMRQITKTTSFPMYTVDGNIGIIGDSTISGYPKYPTLSTYFSVGSGYKLTDISKPGDTVVGQLDKWKTLDNQDKISLNYVFVQIGLNDMDETVDTFRAQYSNLISQIRTDSPNAMIILGTMVPCKGRWASLGLEGAQERWVIANNDIKNGYYDCDRVAYLHTDALGLDGNLRKEYDHGDKIHINTDGAKIVAYSWCLSAFDNDYLKPEEPDDTLDSDLHPSPAPESTGNWLTNLITNDDKKHDEYIHVDSTNLTGNLYVGADIIFYPSEIQAILDGNLITHVTCGNLGKGNTITLYSNPWSINAQLSPAGREVIGTITGSEDEGNSGTIIKTYVVDNPLPIKKGETLAISWDSTMKSVRNSVLPGYKTPVKHKYNSDFYDSELPNFSCFDFYVQKTPSDDSHENIENTDLFVFAGQSNMMGASVLEPKVNEFTDQSYEYKYMPKLRGEETGLFIPAQNPAGEFHYKNLSAAYGDKLYDLSYKSIMSNYSANTYFCPAMRDGVKGFSAQSESDTYPSASLAPYFVTKYAEYGHSSVYAHMAKGAVKIVHYFTEDMMVRYNALISDYNAKNNKNYKILSLANLSGAGDAFDDKYHAMIEDYSTLLSDSKLNNKCFVWLQGEGDADSSYIEYKLKMQVLWEHLQSLGFTHFFVLRVGYWGSTGILNVIQAQEDFCDENDNCYIVTRAPSLIPYPGASTSNWWINEPSSEYDDCRDSYLTSSNNNHFNEKAMQIFANKTAENVHRILYLGLEPILEEENIQGMKKNEEEPEIEDNTPYTSYLGIKDFNKSLSISKKSNGWVEQSYSSSASTDLIPVKSSDSVWLQYVFYLNEAHAVGGFYDEDGKLVAPLYYKNFGFTLGGGSGEAAFKTPKFTNRVSISSIEEMTGKKIAYVRFTAWKASVGGHANTEARIYHEKIFGDVNNDGKVNTFDRMVLSRYLAKWEGYENINLKNADVNCDGIVNAKDRMILTRHIARWQGYEILPYKK